MRPAIRPPRFIVIACCLSLGTLLIQSAAHAVFTEQGATWLGGANYSARSASLADIDGDGDLDLMFQTNTTPFLWRNNVISTGTPSSSFTDITSTIPTATLGPGWSAAWGDYNGDGRVDVFIGQSNSGSATGDVLRNDGGSFSNQSTATGLNDPGFHQNVAWADINNDHRLDLLIGMEGPEKHALYIQDATGHFSNVGASTGFQASFGTRSYGMAIGDTDGDGDLDVYISTCDGSDNIRNNYYKNMLRETGSLSFVDIADTNGTQITRDTYGSEFVDLDNDGDLDLYVTGAGNPPATAAPTKIFRNNGGNMFTDIDTVTGHPVLTDVGSDLNGSKAVDFDNDGDLDLFFHDNLSGTSNVKLYRNDGNWNFTDVTVAQGITNTGAGGYDGVWGDIDRDGDMDLINPNNLTLGGVNTPERVNINDASTNGNRWLYVKLIGPSWDTTGLGSSLYATMTDGSLDGLTLRREANTNADTFNQSDVPVHFGLGTSTKVEWLRVVWPDGTVQFLHNVAANQYLTLSYATALAGDFNGDGKVDSADYVIWRKYYNAPFTMVDYNIWRAHFGQTLTPGSGTGSNVPEPPTIMMLGIIGLTFAAARRR